MLSLKKIALCWALLATVAAVSVLEGSVDVEPAVVGKEQPDFEDDNGMLTGMRAEEEGRDAVRKAAQFTSSSTEEPAPSSPFLHAVIASLCIIVVSELGDKTFFISAIMAMSHPRVTVFAGAMVALAGMHIMSALFGSVIQFIPRVFVFYASSALFAFFGLKMLAEGWRMAADEGKEELEEVQSDLRRREDNLERMNLEEGGVTSKPFFGLMSRVFLQAFTLNVLAEWGDRSQIATVIMAAREDVSGVIIGGLVGHFVCTGLAVMGGRLIATCISVRTVTLIGGVVFLLFAASALFIGP